MSFNLGVSNHPISRLGGLSSIGIYLYEDIYYRQWISEIALAFYEGRQDEFVWLDLVRQFRNPEKQQIIPINFTKEIIDETSIMYRETPIYKVVDAKGKQLPKDQELWENIQAHSRYHTFMDKVDRWTRLLGTVLVKVSFVDPATGMLVPENRHGQVQLDALHGGVYDLKHGSSPYYITELLIGFGTKFGGFTGYYGSGTATIGAQGGLAGTVPSPSNYGQNDVRFRQGVSRVDQLGNVNRIYWSPTSHRQIDSDGREYEVPNPYGIVPAVPFFNSDPAHYYFLPINEPLIYANHTVNMRLTDLNHIAKFQSFGIPVLTGVDRPTSIRQGRPVDDFNILKGGTAQSRFGGLSGASGFGAGGAYRSFDAGLGLYRDGNADAAALGASLGPDTGVSVGEKGDFKFAHPDADITGLIKVIQSITDMVRINHGLRPKFQDSIPASGFARLMEKIGVIDENVRRSKLFKEREQQLFQIIKSLWNSHHPNSGERRFSDEAKLEITYIEPKFPVDPKTEMDTLVLESSILDKGIREDYKKLYPYLSDNEINKKIKQRRQDKEEQAIVDADIQAKVMAIVPQVGPDGQLISSVKDDTLKTADKPFTPAKPPEEIIPVVGEAYSKDKDRETGKNRMDNRMKHAMDSGKQDIMNNPDFK